MNPRQRRPSSTSHILLNSKYIHNALRSYLQSLRLAGVDPAPPLLDSIASYIELLLRWNRKVNLTAITDPGEIVVRNFVESFLAVRWLPAGQGHLCDVGSGAGFPGLALKLLLPGWHITLLEPTLKKAAFLSEAARTLSLRDVVVERCPWQDSSLASGSLDAVTSRALGRYADLARWASRRLKPAGKLILWLGARDAAKLKDLPGWGWEQEAVPESRERVLLIGTL